MTTRAFPFLEIITVIGFLLMVWGLKHND